MSFLKWVARKLQRELQNEKMKRFRRRVSFGDLITERDEIARSYGFGEGTTCYDSVLILGDVKVGRNTWIGPNVVLDGSAGLEIGDFCSISAGAQIYTHNTVRRDTSFHVLPIDKKATRIGSGVYVGPNAIIEMGVTIGDQAVIGACAFVNCDVPSGKKAFGVPARIQ